MIHQIDLSNPPAFLADVETIYTDLDGTMFAKGGTFFTDDSGMPSIEGPRALQALREAGVEVVIATGRNRAQTAEISRILNIPVFIDRSSYEDHPLGRVEWVKVYGVLLGKEDGAAAAFEAQRKL